MRFSTFPTVHVCREEMDFVGSFQTDQNKRKICSTSHTDGHPAQVSVSSGNMFDNKMSVTLHIHKCANVKCF